MYIRYDIVKKKYAVFSGQKQITQWVGTRAEAEQDLAALKKLAKVA